MAKKKPMRQRVKNKERDQAEQEKEKEGALGPGTSSSRVQRKVAKTVKFLEKLKTTQSAIGRKSKGVAKKPQKKKGKQAEVLGAALGSLAESLGSALPTVEQAGKTKLTSKKRQKLVVQETQQMSAVLSHPTFKQDPFSAVLQHLQTTVPKLRQGPPPELKKAVSKRKQGVKARQLA